MMDFSSPVAILGGATGTGKSFTLGQKLLTAATLQRAHRGVRRTHFLVARPSEGDVKESIVKDLEDEILAEIKDAGGVVKFTGQYPVKGLVKFALPDQTEVHCEITAAGFEDQASAKRKLKSKKYTCAFLPEIQTFYDPKVVAEIVQRINRYPTDKDGGIYWEIPMSDGSIATFAGGRLWGDFNYTDKRHWFYKYSVSDNVIKENGEPTRKIYEQPPILLAMPDPHSNFVYKGEKVRFVPNPAAKPYIQHARVRDDEGRPIPDSEYDHWLNQVEQMTGDDASIDENIMAQWGYRTDGRPVFPRFSVNEHVEKGKIQVNPSMPVYVGVDGGFNNAFVFGQEGFTGKLQILDEINNVKENAKPIDNALDEDVIPLLNSKYMGCEVIFILDPSMYFGEGAKGNNQGDEFKKRGLNAVACRTQDPDERLRSGEYFINNRGVLSVASICSDVVSALAGGYNYKILRGGMFSESPDKKSDSSHIGDAFCYLCTQLRRGFSKPKKKAKSRKKRSLHSW